jgi:hypothetical protein
MEAHGGQNWAAPRDKVASTGSNEAWSRLRLNGCTFGQSDPILPVGNLNYFPGVACHRTT